MSFYFISSRGWSELSDTGILFQSRPPQVVLERWSEDTSKTAFYYRGYGSEVHAVDDVPARAMIKRADDEFDRKSVPRPGPDDVVVPTGALWLGGAFVFFLGAILGSAAASTTEHHYHGGE